MLFVVDPSLNINFKMMACTTVITIVRCHLIRTDFFIQEINAIFETSSKCLLYNYLQDTFFSPTWQSRKPYLFPVKYRLSYHKLVIEQDRYNGIVRVERIWRRVPFLSLYVPCSNIYEQLFLFQAFNVQSDVTYVSS